MSLGSSEVPAVVAGAAPSVTAQRGGHTTRTLLVVNQDMVSVGETVLHN